MNWLFMTAQAFFTDGQKKIQVPKYPVMRRDVEINWMEWFQLMLLQVKSIENSQKNHSSEDVSDDFWELCQDCLRAGFDQLTIILDNNSTHKKLRKYQLKFHLINAQISDKIVVYFIQTPTYSPNFNWVEYIIHLLRLKLLHHLSWDVNIQQVQDKLEKFFQFNQLQTPEQIQNIIRHICTLA